MKIFLLLTLVVSMLIGSTDSLCAQAGPGWASSERPTKEQALAHVLNAGANAPANLSVPTFEEQVATEAEASASLALRVTPTSNAKGLTTSSSASLLNAPTPTLGGNSADFITPEILNLAAGLNYDPAKIYEYVRNYIEYEDYFGSKKGAYLTLLEGSGNSFDQSALLVALLRASGYAPQYQYGPAIFSYVQLTRWLGLNASPFSHQTDAQFLAANLLPANTPVASIPNLRKKLAIFYFFDAHGYFFFDTFDLSTSEIAVVIPHVWVSVTVNGIAYDKLSPAWKDSSDSNKITLGSAMGYSRADFLTQAGGTVSTPDAVSGLNYTTISNTLSNYSTALTNYLKANEPARAANRITGSRSITKTTVSNLSTTRLIYPSTFSSDWLPSETWTAIPEVHISKLQILLGQGWNPTTKVFDTLLYDHTLNMTELRGRKLSLSFSGNNARVSLDDAILTAPVTVAASSVQMRVSAMHNHNRLTRQTNGTYPVTATGRNNQDEVKTYLKGDNFAYAIIYSFGNAENHLRKREEVLDNYRRAGLADTDWRVVTEVLNVMGLNWMHQTYLQEQILAPLFQTLPVDHHRFGRVSQESSYYIDIGLQLSAGQSRISNEAERNELYALSGFFASSMEHSVIEQLQGENQNAVSTVKLLYLANESGQKIYRATGGNWSSINTGSLLQNYSADTKTTIQGAVNAGGKALIPQNAQITLNQWRGIGYAIQEKSMIRMLIGGNLFGGYNSTPAVVNSTPTATSYSSNPAYNLGPKPGQRSPFVSYTTPQFSSSDPVDMASGAFLLDKPDLSVGGGNSPRSISFERQYNSNRRYDKSAGLGYGWTHNYQMSVTKRSSVKASLGDSISYHAVPFYVAAQVASDLFRNHANAKEWATASLVTQWFSDQLKYHAVAVSMGNKTIEFIRMPDGSYDAPANMNYTLSRSGSGTTETFAMTQRHGPTYTFNVSGRIATITDLWGKVMNFSYAGGNLTSVTDSYGRALNLTWTSGRITAVSDTNNRSVGFSYTGDDLTGCIDVEGKNWSYFYDAQHRITETKDPSNRTIIRNVYDTENRVSEQYTFGDVAKRYDLTYTGFCNTEQNPQTGRTCYLYDSRSRGIGTIDPLGNRTDFIYDGHDHMTSVLSPEVEITDQYFDRYNNLTRVNDPIGADLLTSYDTAQRPITRTDKRGNVTTINSYNSQHQPLQVTAPLNRVTSTSYTANGEVDIATDPEGNVMDHDYNALGQLIQIKINGEVSGEFTYNAYGDVATSKDGLGQATSIIYNKRRQVTSTTLQAIAGQPVTIITNTYNDEGLLLSTVDSRNNVTSFTHSATGNPLTSTAPAITTATGELLNNVVTNSYDARDWFSESVNSLGHTSTAFYDAAHRVTQGKDPLNRSTFTAYDKNSRPTQTTDALNRVTKTAYSLRSEPITQTDALTKNTGYLFDANGNQTRITNRRGKSYHIVYDTANRVGTITTPTGKVTTSTYFLNDLQKTITEPSTEVTSVEYDTRLRLKKKTDPVGVVNYSYDLASNLKNVTEAGTSISRNYDARNRLVNFTTADGDSIQYLYDASNNLTRLTYPDGKQVNYTYNARNLLVTVTDWSNRTTTYTYDRLGRVTGTLRPNGTANQIAHDAANQLTSIRETSGGKLINYLAFQYDAASQIKSRLRAPLVNSGWQHPSLVATYDDDNRLLTANGTNVTHDVDGNMTRSVGILPTSLSTSVNLTYNSRNQLTNAAGVSYTYDAEGRRRSLTDATGTTRDVIDPSGKLLVRISPSGTKTYYVYGLGLLYEANQADTTKTYHFDQVGSTLLRTDDSGKVIGQAEYSAYGLTTWKQGDMATPFLYNGQAGVQTDPNGLLNMRARYYSPYLMRFLNADPSGFSGGPNWFAYADGNPISKSDPFGLCAGSGGGVWNTIKGAGQAQLNNLSSGAGFLMDGVANTFIGIPQGMAFMADQMHHVASGNLGSLGSSSHNGGMNDAMQGLKNPYGNQGYYDPGMASNVRDAALGAAAIVYGGGVRGGGAAANTGGRIASEAGLSAGEITRIQNAANAIGKPINLVGSRAGGTATAASDWDYVIEGMTNANKNTIKNSLPGAPIRADQVPRNIDFFTDPLRTDLPHIQFNPR